MRRGFSALILGLSLVLATVAWSGFVLNRTALDPSRSERLAEQLFENETLRSALVSELASAMQTTIPSEVAVPRQIMEQAAAAALSDPGVRQLIEDGLVNVHRSALEGNAEPVTIDAAALGVAGRNALVGINPELDAYLPNSPELQVELPVGGLSALGTVRDFTEKATTVLAVAAIAGATAAFVLAKNRAAILRRVAFWAFGAAAFWVIVGFGVPFLAERLAPRSLAIVAAITDVFFGAMIRPGLFMAGFGAAMLGASFFWAAGSASLGSRVLQPTGTPSPAPAVHQPVPAARAARVGATQSNVRQPSQAPSARPSTPRQQPYGAPSAAAGGYPTGQHQPGQYPPVQNDGWAPAQSPHANPTGDPTRAMPGGGNTGAPRSTPQNPGHFGRPAPRWEPGVGYIDEP